MKTITFLTSFLLLSLCLGQSCPVSQLNETFFATGKPKFLSTPALHPSDDTICPSFVGSQSCCDKSTLADIKVKYDNYKATLTKAMESQLQALENGFSKASNLDYKALLGDATGERIRLILEKIITMAKTKIVLVRPAMALCFTSLYKVQAGFLCTGCNTSLPVSVNGTNRPKFIIHKNVIDRLSDDCKNYSSLIRDAVDEYHRARAQITDYLTAEIGVQEDTCTCDGTRQDDSNTFNITFNGVAPPNQPPVQQAATAPGYGRLLQETTMIDASTAGAVGAFQGDSQRPRNDTIPNIVNNGSYGPEKEADNILRNDTKNYVDRKDFKRKAFVDYKTLGMAIYMKVSRNLNNRNYDKIAQDLKSLVSFNEFDFEEGLTIAIRFCRNVANYTLFWFPIRQLIVKLALDALLNIPMQTGGVAGCNPPPPPPTNVTMNRTNQQKPANSNGTQPQQQANGTQPQQQQNGTQPQQQQNGTQPAQQQNGTQPAQNGSQPAGNRTTPPPKRLMQTTMNVQIGFQNVFFQMMQVYSRNLSNLALGLLDNDTLPRDMPMPLIMNNEMRAVRIFSKSDINYIAGKEVELLTKGAILMPLFSVMSYVNQLLAALSSTSGAFADLLEKLTDDDKRFIQLTYFPPKYYRRRTHLVPNNTIAPDIAAKVIDMFTSKILKPIALAAANCVGLFMRNPAVQNIIINIKKSSKDGLMMEGANKNMAKLSEQDQQKMQTCEANRKYIKQNKKCNNDSNCMICYMARNSTITQLTMTADTTIDDIDSVIKAARRGDGQMGNMDIQEMAPYDDEEAIQMAKCARMFSARTKMCVPLQFQNQLNITVIDDAPSFNDNDRGASFAKAALSGSKLLEAQDVFMPTNNDIPASRLLVYTNGDEMELSAQDNGVDTMNMKTGLSSEVSAGDTSVKPTVFSSASSYAISFALLLITLIALI